MIVTDLCNILEPVLQSPGAGPLHPLLPVHPGTGSEPRGLELGPTDPHGAALPHTVHHPGHLLPPPLLHLLLLVLHVILGGQQSQQLLPLLQPDQPGAPGGSGERVPVRRGQGQHVRPVGEQREVGELELDPLAEAEAEAGEGQQLQRGALHCHPGPGPHGDSRLQVISVPANIR